jgi:hypothetical protein
MAWRKYWLETKETFLSYHLIEMLISCPLIHVTSSNDKKINLFVCELDKQRNIVPHYSYDLHNFCLQNIL